MDLLDLSHTTVGVNRNVPGFLEEDGSIDITSTVGLPKGTQVFYVPYNEIDDSPNADKILELVDQLEGGSTETLELRFDGQTLPTTFEAELSRDSGKEVIAFSIA
jgi:hypothetical protein